MRTWTIWNGWLAMVPLACRSATSRPRVAPRADSEHSHAGTTRAGVILGGTAGITQAQVAVELGREQGLA